LKNVEVVSSHDELVVDIAKSLRATCLGRGLPGTPTNQTSVGMHSRPSTLPGILASVGMARAPKPLPTRPLRKL